MKLLPAILIFIILLCAVECRNHEQNIAIGDIDSVGVVNTPAIIKSKDPEGLEYWTDDTIIKANHRLVSLMDTLYRYTRGNTDDIEDYFKWMGNYRGQLCDYYLETRPMADSISEFAMADSVIAEADELWNLHKDDSTMGIYIGNDIARTRMIFLQFNEYEKLNVICENAGQQKILLTEFTEWIKLERLFCDFFANCTSLRFWGGSIQGPIKTRGAIDILKAHTDLYKKENLILSRNVDSWEDNGTFLKPTRNLLIDCCEHAIDQYYEPEEPNDMYENLYKDTKSILKKLPEHIDAWCKSRQPWEEEMCTDWLRPEYPRHTAEVLIKLAHIISSVQ